MELSLKVKKAIKEKLPGGLLRCYRKIKGFFLHIKNKQKPASDVFSEIYAKNLWGESRKSGEFYSGPGSEGTHAQQYVDKINNFIKSLNRAGLHIVDLGCGDFRIGEKIAKENNVHYIGVDVVPALIERNKNEYKRENLKFGNTKNQTILPQIPFCFFQSL